MPAPLGAGSSPTSAIGNLLAGNGGSGADQVQAQLQALAGQIRDVGTMVDAIAQDFPAGAQEASQIKLMLKAILVKAAQTAPDATASGSAVPTGASAGPNA